MSDGSPNRFAIQMKDGTYYGQKWEGNTRRYLSWPTLRRANNALKKIKDGKSVS